MLNRTHLAVILLLIIVLFPIVPNKISFVTIALASSIIPDVDIKNSKIGKYKIFRPLQFFTKHRGFFHCLLFMCFLILFFLNFYPAGAFAFFLGYSSHLVMDSITPEGVQFFYPYKKRISGRIKTGGRIENLILITSIVLGITIIILRIFKI